MIRINLYLGFKDSMKLRDDKDVKSRLSLFYNFIGISNKICIRYNMKVFNNKEIPLKLRTTKVSISRHYHLLVSLSL